MSMNLRLGEPAQVFPVLSPADIVATATSSQYVDLNFSHWVTFLVYFGAMTSDSTDIATVTVECSTAGSSNATESAIAFNYRLTSAVGDYSHGAITAATATGVAIPATSDGKLLIIDVDPSVVAANAADMRFIRLTITPSAEVASCVVGASVVLETRYPGNAIPSST